MTGAHLHVLTTWRGPDGSLASHQERPVASEREAAALVEVGFAKARRAGGRDVKVAVIDDLAGRTLAVNRRREST